MYIEAGFVVEVSGGCSYAYRRERVEVGPDRSCRLSIEVELLARENQQGMMTMATLQLSSMARVVRSLYTRVYGYMYRCREQTSWGCSYMDLAVQI